MTNEEIKTFTSLQKTNVDFENEIRDAELELRGQR